jgi:serine/threonine protein kinase
MGACGSTDTESSLIFSDSRGDEHIDASSQNTHVTDDALVRGSFKGAPIFESLPDGRRAITFQAQKTRDEKKNELAEQVLVGEMTILQKLMSPEKQGHLGRQRIIELVRAQPDPPASMTLELVQPFGCDLYNMVERYVDAQLYMSELQLGHIMYQLCEALDYLQLCNIVHGDLKAENVCIKHGVDIKVLDFGAAAESGTTPSQPWPQNDHIAPEARCSIVPAAFPQDLYGIGYLIMRVSSAIKSLPSAIESTGERLRARRSGNRMTLEELKSEAWVKKIDSQELLQIPPSLWADP